jgi:hypothetical protein
MRDGNQPQVLYVTQAQAGLIATGLVREIKEKLTGVGAAFLSVPKSGSISNLERV